MIKENLKNIIGWKSNRKLVVFSVDDYGNVRLSSKNARKNLDKAGLKINSRFDAFDALENYSDLEMLFEALQSVKDKNGNNAVFSTFALPCNINFEAIIENCYEKYVYELLPETYKKLSHEDPTAYEGSWNLWQTGVLNGLLAPQFHGREHFNLSVFNDKLAKNDKELKVLLSTKSFTGISNTEFSKIRTNAAFDFISKNEFSYLESILTDGINRFKQVFGFNPVHFTPPMYSFPTDLYGKLFELGIKFIDVAMIQKQHLGNGKYATKFNYTGNKNKTGLRTMVRNVVFEPTEGTSIDWIAFALKQIEASFRWKRPAIISSHRVNFCGHINPLNREKGITALRLLLKAIIIKWPDVEFLSLKDLDYLIAYEKDN